MVDVLVKIFIHYHGELMEILESNDELQKSARDTFQQAAWSAGGAAVVGFFLGSVGAMIGGIGGSVIGHMCSDDYSSMNDVLQNLNDEDKEKIGNTVKELVERKAKKAFFSWIGNQLLKLPGTLAGMIQKQG